MKDLKNILLNEQAKLTEIIKKSKLSLLNVPDGKLWACTYLNRIEYYHINGNYSRKAGGYISKDNIELARQLAQKEYNQKVLKLVEKRNKQIKSILKDYDDNEIDLLFKNTAPARRSLITPIEPTFEQKIEAWLSIPYTGKAISSDIAIIKTHKGEQVRSKSEKIIADMLYNLNIPYKYECPLNLKGFGTVYPDFTIYSRLYDGEVYIEHEGMMDNSEYAEAAVKKIESYEKNGFFPGERLVLTYETSKTSLNTEYLETILRRHI